MNFVDLILLIVILLSLWGGWHKGFILGTTDLITWVGSVLIGFLLYGYVADFLKQYITNLGVWTVPFAFLLTIILARLVLGLLFRAVLKLTTHEVHTHGVNRALGLIPGFFNGLLYAMLLAALLMALPLSGTLTATTRDSRIANEMAEGVEWLNDKLSPVFDEAVNQSVNHLSVKPESERSVDLNFTVSNPKARPDLEARMLELVNEERRREGLPPLKADPEIAVVARAHSRDMFARGYFSHVNPEGKTPGQRIRDGGVKFLVAGENLALAPTLMLAHNGLMKSPGHRANILHKSYGRLGIGILDGGIRGLMVTQNFRN